jgi:predicted ATPase
VHWADEATLATLPHLIPTLLQKRAFVVLTYRIAEARERPIVWETLAELDWTLPLRLRLKPFDSQEAAAFLGRALDASTADSRVASFAERLHLETGGNPLFLVESLKSVSAPALGLARDAGTGRGARRASRLYHPDPAR